MIIGAELGRWLSSAELQGATSGTMEEVRGRWSRHSLWREVRAQVENSNGDVAVLMSAARRVLGSDEVVTEVLGDMIEATASDPFFRPPYPTVGSELHSGLLLFSSPELLVSVGIIRLEPLAAKKAGPRGPTSIMFNGERTLLRLLCAGGATFSFWEAPPAGEDFQAETAGGCRLVGRRTMEDGEILLVDGRTQSFVIEHASSDIVLIQAAIHSGASPLSLEYDSRTGAFLGASSTDESGSRLEMMATLMRLLDVREALPLVAKSIEGSSFHTRWHLMRELLAWDAEAALPNLRDMAERDPHPEVRDAARRTLAMLLEEEEEPECLV
ncbi:MAG TPA: HEAT repeat domain-containing protein [Allosphingosinicella sp.]|jgi:hypothetical protein